MAISLAHMSQEASRRRATTLPSSSQPWYNPGEFAMVPGIPAQPCSAGSAPTYPAANLPWVGIPVEPMSYAPELRHSYQPGTEYAQPQAPPSGVQPQKQLSPQYQPPVTNNSTERPPLPPRPSEQPPSPHDSVQSSGSSSADCPPSWRISIEPDPLPPHSNPQALSQTQSEAFSGTERIPDLSLGLDELWNTTTGLAEFRINRDTSHLPKLLSSKKAASSLTVTRTSNGQALGTVKFHTFSSTTIDLILPSGRSTSISHSGILHNRWGFQTLSSINTSEHWYWKKDRSTGGAMLEDSKHHKHRHGEVLARLQGNNLEFVKPRLRDEEYDEIVLSAFAMVEAARRRKGKVDVLDFGGAVGELMGD